MNALAIFLAILLGAIAALHAYWAMGGLWPGRDEAGLIDYVFGDQGRRRTPPAAVVWIVAAAIMVTALWPLVLTSAIRPPLPRVVIAGVGVAIAGVFLLRGAAGYLPAWRRAHAREPFATLDVRFYSPLCLMIAAGYAALLIGLFDQ